MNAYAELITARKSLSKNITIIITTDTTDHSLFLLLTGKTQYLGGGGKGVGGRGGYRRLRYEQCTNTAKRESMGIVLVRKTDFTKQDFFVIWLDNNNNASI